MWKTLTRFFSKTPAFEMSDIQALCLELPCDRPGSLAQYLKTLEKYQINLTHIESKPTDLLDSSRGFTFTLDLDESTNNHSLQKVVSDLEGQGVQVKLQKSKEVPWFPRHLLDLDLFDNKYLTAGVELESDHPGFKDEEYRKRRQEIAEIAYTHKLADPSVPRVKYTERELRTWQMAYETLMPELEKHACQDCLTNVHEMREFCGFRADNIPQIEDINQYLLNKTNFRLMPVAGLLSGRDFLACLAFRVFASTQYIRHHSVPFYTPEPDIVHELMGHAPLFANPDFAAFSQQLGLASLGASEEEIKKLATLYWFTVEFGIILDENNNRKAYGAGVLSSVDELRNAMDPNTKARFFEPEVACNVPYPITTLQPVYWYSRSFEEAKKLMVEYSKNMVKPVTISWDKNTSSIKVFQKIRATLNNSE